MKRKGVTLVEVMVTIACSMILLGAITASFYFVSGLNNNVLEVSTENYQVKKVRDFIYANKDTNDFNGYKVLDGDVYYEDSTTKTIIVTESNITKIESTNSDGLVKYTITYGENETLIFTVEVKANVS